jgi:transcription antitermination protein NusB
MKMGARTSGREAALQMLFALEAGGGSAERVIMHYWRLTPGDPEGREYADQIVRGIAADLAQVDETIRKASTNWRLERMTRVDRNVLRLGAWELAKSTDVPRAVILDEAVELAKRFGSEESGAFVNGVLDRAAEDVGRVDRDKAAEDDQGKKGGKDPRAVKRAARRP